jgi:hypothetical protein
MPAPFVAARPADGLAAGDGGFHIPARDHVARVPAGAIGRTAKEALI